MMSCLDGKTEDEKDEDGKGCNQLLVSSCIDLLGDEHCSFAPGSHRTLSHAVHDGGTAEVGRSCTGQEEGRSRVRDEEGEGVHETKMRTKKRKLNSDRCTRRPGCDGGCGVMNCVGGGWNDRGCGCYCCCCCVGCGSCLTSVV